MSGGPRYRAGLMVEFVGLPAIIGRFNGYRFTLEGDPLYHKEKWCWDVPLEVALEVSLLFLRSGPTRVVCEEANLKPIYDGNQVVSWFDCAWRPEHMYEV
jgi:hypothetical protein